MNRTKTVTKILAGIILIVGTIGCRVDQEKEQLLVTIVNTQFEKPFALVEVVYFRDGGTTGFHLRDKKGKDFKFCENQVLAGELKKTNGRLYWGVLHPTEPGSVLIEDKLEERKLRLLAGVVVQNELAKFGREKIDEMISTGELEPTDKAWQLLRAAHFVEKEGNL